MKIVILDAGIANPGDLSWESLAALGSLEIHDDTPYGAVAETVGDAEAIITNKVPITADTIARCKKLKYIGLLATGYNVIDVAAAKAAGIPVCNVPGYSTASVAQHTLALLLEITNQAARHSSSVHAGKWSSGKWCFWDVPLIELYGKTFGAVGFGSIGRAAGRIAGALGMHILACGSTPTAEGRAIAEYVTQDELLARSDVVSLHCPLLPATKDLICDENIKKMKDGAILLNTARGGLVVEQDLAGALNSGKLYAAGLDVVAVEPIPAGSPLLTAKNCFITPHTAWVPAEARRRLLNVVAENLAAFIGGKPANVVNP